MDDLRTRLARKLQNHDPMFPTITDATALAERWIADLGLVTREELDATLAALESAAGVLDGAAIEIREYANILSADPHEAVVVEICADQCRAAIRARGGVRMASAPGI
jgi:hypothetical protein